MPSTAELSLETSANYSYPEILAETHGEDGAGDIYARALAEVQRLCASVSLSNDADSLTAYLARLNYLAPLSAPIQQKLAERYIDVGDADAAKLLVLTNLRLVVKLAREYQRRKTDLLELIQQGNLGLSEALTRYDPERGVKFTSYAQYWVRAMILNYLMNQTHSVRIGGSRAGRKLFYNLKKARRALIQNGQRPTAAAVADYLNVSEREVARVAAQLDAPPVFLDAQAPGHEGTTIGELMPSAAVDPETTVANHDLGNQVRRCIDEFGEAIEEARLAAIWHKRMVADDPLTLAELGDEWGVSKERIRQLESELRDDFRIYLTDKLGDDVEFEWL